MQKIKKYIKNNLSIILSVSIVFFIFLFICIFNKMWPFGNKSFAVYDLSGQITQQFTHIYDVLQGKSSLFYTNRLGGGMSIFGTLVYFIMSPSYILMFIGGRANVEFSINLVVMAYFVLMAGSMSYMLKKIFPTLKQYLQIILSISYCFCGFVLQNYTFTTWLNFLVLGPFMVVAFKRLINEKKYLTFSLLTFFYIISCFGMGSITQLVLLGIYYLYIAICVDKENRKDCLVRLTVSVGVGVLFSSVVLIPAMFAMKLGTRAGGLFDFIFSSAVDKEIVNKLAYVLVEFAYSIFAIFFIIFSNKKDKFNKFLSIVLAGLIFILFVDVAMMLLCFGHNRSYPTRLTFMFSIFIVIAIAKLILDCSSKEETQRENKWANYTVFALMIIVSITFVVMLISKQDSFYSLSYRMSVNAEIESDIQFFLPFFIIFAVMFVVLMLASKFKKLSAKLLRLGFAIILLSQTLVGVILFSERNYSVNYYINGYELLQVCDEYDRVSGFCKNGKIYAGANGIGVFSSMISKKNYEAFKYWGYHAKENTIYETGGTLFTDSFMGIKYYFKKSKSNSRYLTLVKSNGSYLYENKYATTGAFLIDKNYGYDYNVSVFGNQNILARALGANKDLFEITNMHELLLNSFNDIEVKKGGVYHAGDGNYKTYQGATGLVSFRPTDNQNVIYYISFAEGYFEYYKNCNVDYEDNPLFIHQVGDVGLMVDFSLNSQLDLSKILVARLDLDLYEEQLELIRQNQVEVNYTKNGFNVTVDKVDGKKLVVTNVNIKGMKAKNNSKNVNIDDCASGFISINLNEGTNKISVYYSNPFLLPSILISLICIAIAISVIILYNKKYKKLPWLEKVVDWCYKAYAVVLVAFLFVFTGILTIIKFLL